MAVNCGNTVTPKMVRNGQVKVGDAFRIEDFIDEMDFQEVEVTDAVNGMTAARHDAVNGMTATRHDAVSGMTATKPATRNNIHHPLQYEEITPYMNAISYGQAGSDNSIPLNVPQTPLATEMYSETLDVTDVQAYTGFLRTQIGRYMRIEQLVGTDTTRDRYGYLVGVGTNFIILQEGPTGNIMVVDLFTIRMTYIYYSDATAR